MPIMFNTLLEAAALNPNEVRLLRHKDQRAAKGKSPYELWRDDKAQFESYQSSQRIKNRKILTAPFWAVFIVNLNNESMFGGIYAVTYNGLLEVDTPVPSMEGAVDLAGSCDMFDLQLTDKLKDMIGKLFIDWGGGERAWIQYADKQNKIVTELRPEYREDHFPGFMEFLEPLSRLSKLPKNWETALGSSRGVYLLTCPKTKLHYVGSARGVSGFWGRWQNYVQTGHGGNVGLKSVAQSDYQVSILEVAGTLASEDDILRMEGRWQSKIKGQLNMNWTGGV